MAAYIAISVDKLSGFDDLAIDYRHLYSDDLVVHFVCGVVRFGYVANFDLGFIIVSRCNVLGRWLVDEKTVRESQLRSLYPLTYVCLI